MFPPDPPHPERTRPIGSFADPAAGTVPTLAVRIGAKIFDLLIQGIPGAVLSAVFVDWGDGDVVAMMASVPLWVQMVSAFVPVLYDFVSVAATGRTFGKALFGIRVVRMVDGGRVDISRSLMRAIVPALGGILALGLPFGGLWIVWQPVVYARVFYDPQRRGLHDRAAGSIVLYD
ncbi:MAG TPA: RDD family protein [Microthrixaceae bacterium]|nr:RDD family protein [Microthrixaceae bacterium]